MLFPASPYLKSTRSVYCCTRRTIASTAKYDDRKPKTVLEWEKLAELELSKTKNTPFKTVDALRTQRLSPEGIAIQPVYYDLSDNASPEMPGVAPFTRGPYASMYIGRPWSIRQYGGMFSFARTRTLLFINY